MRHMVFKVLAPTTTRVKVWNKEPGVSGNQGGCMWEVAPEG